MDSERFLANRENVSPKAGVREHAIDVETAKRLRTLSEELPE
jgi:hypothetical protein